MFTGIVEEIGSILEISKGINSLKISIKGKKVLENTKIGDSIAVNGVCLTVTSMSNASFCADAMPETLRMTSLKYLSKGSLVNLERAACVGDRLGGHIVSGHIDGIGRIESIKEDDIAVWYEIIPDDIELLKYIIYKGSVALDGISLTVAELGDSSFKVSTIPHTRDITCLSYKKIGDPINIECDIISKYVERLVKFKTPSYKESNITENFLKENGYI